MAGVKAQLPQGNPVGFLEIAKLVVLKLINKQLKENLGAVRGSGLLLLFAIVIIKSNCTCIHRERERRKREEFLVDWVYNRCRRP